MRPLAAVAAVILLTGCPGPQPEDASRNSPPKTTTTTANPQAVPEKSNSMLPEVAAGAATAPIDVQLTEYEIRMPDSITAGVHTFHIANAGKENHSFGIGGNDVSEKLSADLTRGETADLSVDLKPGTYTVYCPVDKHRGRGMQRTLTVK